MGWEKEEEEEAEKIEESIFFVENMEMSKLHVEDTHSHRHPILQDRWKDENDEHECKWIQCVLYTIFVVVMPCRWSSRVMDQSAYISYGTQCKVINERKSEKKRRI